MEVFGKAARKTSGRVATEGLPSRSLNRKPESASARVDSGELRRDSLRLKQASEGWWRRRELVLLRHDAVVTCIQNFAADTNKKARAKRGHFIWWRRRELKRRLADFLNY